MNRADAIAGWKAWDAANPPPAGRYVVWDPFLSTPGEKVWTFRPVEFGEKWKRKRGEMSWYGEGNWPTDRAPAYYCPLPVFTSKP